MKGCGGCVGVVDPVPIPCAHCGAVPVTSENGQSWIVTHADDCIWLLFGHPSTWFSTGAEGRPGIEAWNRRNGPQTC